jgi:hypothetical protein
MERHAGRASFQLPDGWLDQSTYSYASSDRRLKVTLFFDSAIDEPTSDAVIADRLATAKAILPKFRIIAGPEQVKIAGLEGTTVTFDNQDADRATRTRLLVALFAPRNGIVITAQGPAIGAAEFERIWQAFLASFAMDGQGLLGRQGG